MTHLHFYPLHAALRLLAAFLLCLSGAVSGAQSLSLLKDIYPGAEHGFPQGEQLVELNGKFYFAGFSPAYTSSRLYVTDGTPAGTIPLAAAANAADVYLLRSTGKKLFFEAFNGVRALFSSDGVTIKQIKSLNGIYLADILPLDEQRVLLCIATAAGADPTELWVSDGTAQGTSLLGKYATRPPFMLVTRFGKQVVITENSTNWVKVEPLITDGTKLGTKTVKAWAQTFAPYDEVSSAYGVGDKIFLFGVKNFFTNAVVSNGTAAGTKPHAFDYDYKQIIQSGGGYFIYGDARKLAYYDTASTDVYILRDDIGSGSKMVAAGKKIYFTNDNNPFLALELWEADSETKSTKYTGVRVADWYLFQPAMLIRDNILYFTRAVGATATLDRLPLGTKNSSKICDLYPNGSLSYETPLQLVSDKLVFARNTTAQGNELWTYSLSTVGTGAAATGDWRLRWSGRAFNGVMEGPVDGESLDLRLYDLQGRLLQTLRVNAGSFFQLQNFTGTALLQVTGKQGVKAFHIAGDMY